MISSPLLTSYQSCRRRSILESRWQYAKWRPKSLWLWCLKRAIEAMSHRTSVEEAAADARKSLRDRAASPGFDLDSGVSPWQIAQDLSYTLTHVIHSIPKLPALSLPAPVELSPGIEWQFTNLSDGQRLYRFVAWDRLEDDYLWREIHSWNSFGDIVASGLPMDLYIFVIGSRRGSRFCSPWNRCWKHPATGQLRFQRWEPRNVLGSRRKGATRVQVKQRTSLGGKWLVADAQDVRLPPEDWVALMRKDDIISRVYRVDRIGVPTEEQRSEAISQILNESSEMNSQPRRWQDVPMSRGACDDVVPCPMQAICYAPEPLEDIRIGHLGLYWPKPAARKAPSAAAGPLRLGPDPSSVCLPEQRPPISSFRE